MASTASQRLSFDDVQILRLESAAICGHTAKLNLVEPDRDGEPLPADRLRARIGERVEALPRLRQRVELPRSRVSPPRWADDPHFDLANHVVVSNGPPLDEGGLRLRVGELMGERLDHERPLWRLDLLPLEEARTAIVGRIHHCMADGVSAMRILAGALWDPPTPRGERGPRSSSGGEGGGAHPSPPAPARPGRRRRPTIIDLPGAFRRELGPGADSPLDRHIGARREVAWTSYPLTELKRIEHGAGEGITVNDVVLAAVAGALRRWLQSGGGWPQNLKAKVPVSLHSRREGPGEVGNRDSFLFVDLPITEPDPIERLRMINRETHERKLDHDAESLYAFFHSLAHFRPLYQEVTRLTSGPRQFALSVSNVPGPRDPVTVMGREVSRFCSFAEPADRHALRVAVVSLGGEVAFGFCSDPDAVPSLNRIASELEDSLAELDREAEG
jgi:WS/DGAT/MGAT family acyltransferase